MAKSPQAAPRNEKAAAAKKQAEAQVKREQRRVIAIWVVVGVVLVAIFAALVAFIVQQDKTSTPTAEGQLVPTVTTATDGIPVGQGGVVGEDLDPERVQLDIYLDFMCPICGGFEDINGAEIQAMSQEGLIDVNYHPISILDSTSLGTKYSTRSASTSVLIAEEAPEYFTGFLVALFANQPEEGTPGLSDTDIQDIATSVGVPDDVVAKIPSYSYADWITGATERASIAGVTGTPTIFIDGVNQAVDVDGDGIPDGVNWTVPGNLRLAVESAAAAN